MTGPAGAIDVVIPSYRRPDRLAQCLDAMRRQEVAPARVVVVARHDDHETAQLVAREMAADPTLVLAHVREPGVIAALTEGVRHTRAPVVAFTDDDATPRPDWIRRLRDGFADPTVAALGGRDVVPGEEGPLTDLVGRFRWWGKLVGNHHLGQGPARDVDTLKGVNMAVRTEALALPAPGVLRGAGAQVDFEVLVCRHAHRFGRIVYDPAIVVDHRPAPRADGERHRLGSAAVRDAAHNAIVAATATRRRDLPRLLAFGLFVGTRDRPGLVRAAAAVLRREPDVARRLAPAVAGRLWGAARVVSRPWGRTPVLAARAEPGRPRRVILVAHAAHDRGGTERAVAELVRGLHGEVELVVVAVELADDLRPLVHRWVRIRIPRRPMILRFVLFWILAGWAVARQRRRTAALVHTTGAIVPNRADLITVHFDHAAARRHAARPSRRLRRLNTSAAWWIADVAERWCYRPARAAMLVAVSHGVAEEIRHDFPGVTVDVVPNGVDVVRFRPDPERRATARHELGATDDTFVVLFVGGEWYRKGLDLAVEAIGLMAQAGRRTVLWVVGDGDTVRMGEQAARVGADVRFLGRRTDTERWYAGADAFVLPTTYETFSLVLLEAAASGLAAVVSPVHAWFGDDPDGAGATVVPRDPAAIAEALCALADDPAGRTARAARARTAAQELTWSRVAGQYASLYASIYASTASSA